MKPRRHSGLLLVLLSLLVSPASGQPPAAQLLESAEKAVEARERETAATRLAELSIEDLQQMVALGADWDALGWVHFQLGNLDQVEKYLHAAWMLTQSAVVGDHLGQLYERQKKRKQAANAYAFALASGRAPPGTRSRLLDLLVSESRVEAAVNRAREELTRQRTVKLGRITAKEASAEFFVLFSRGPKVEEVKFIRGDEELRAAAGVLAAARFDVPFPDQGPTRLVRRGILTCARGRSGCSFALLTPDSVHSVN